MMQAIDLVKEDQRLTGVEFSKSSAPAGGEDAGCRRRRRRATGAAKTLEEAEQAYSSRELEKSKKLFLKTLEQTDKRALHASAYYGLARIALLEKDLDAAERLFQKSLESEPEAFDKAWVLVYLGRLSVAAGDRDKATEVFPKRSSIGRRDRKGAPGSEAGPGTDIKKQ